MTQFVIHNSTELHLTDVNEILDRLNQICLLFCKMHTNKCDKGSLRYTFERFRIGRNCINQKKIYLK